MWEVMESEDGRRQEARGKRKEARVASKIEKGSVPGSPLCSCTMMISETSPARQDSARKRVCEGRGRWHIRVMPYKSKRGFRIIGFLG
jgi:hypothetical protein